MSVANFTEMFRTAAVTRPDHPAVISGDSRLTWLQLYAAGVALRNHLSGLSLKRGDTVAIFTEHNLSQPVAILGAGLCDARFTILNNLLKEEQIKHQIADSNASVVVCTRAYYARVEPLAELMKIPIVVVDHEGVVEGAGASPEVDPTHVLTEDIPADVSCLMYTSGSTGRSKGVVVPHRTLTDGARIVGSYLSITKDDRILSVLPYSFDYGLNQLLSIAYRAGTIVMHKFAMPQDLLNLLIKHEITGLAAVPPMWTLLLDPRLASKSEDGYSSLRYVTSGGGRHSEKLLKRIADFFPNTEIFVMYGLTESFRSTYLPPSELFKRPGSIGKAVPEVEIMVLDADRNPCKPGVEGELYHRGAFVNYGYLNNEKLTKEKYIPLPTGPGLLPETMVRSGDIVSLDEDGFLYFHGRSDFQIKCSGYRVSAGEVEEVFLKFPGVRQVLVFGIPSEELGEEVCLAYSMYDGKEADEAHFVKELKNALPSFAVPRKIRQYPELPLTPNGKFDVTLMKKHAQE